MSTNLITTNSTSMKSTERGRDNNKRNDVINLVDLFLYLRGHMFTLIAAFIFGAFLAAAGSYIFITPTYKSSSEIYIVSASNNSVVNLTDLQIGSSLASDYADLLVSRPMMESVLENLNLDYTVKDLKSMIEIENPDDTRILTITVTSDNPNKSADIANEIAELAVDWLPSIMECETPNIVEDAIPATEKAGPSLKKAAVEGAVVGLLIVAGIYTLIFVNDDTIHTAEDLEHYFGMAPLASIPEDYSNPALKIKKSKSSSKKSSRKYNRKAV